MIFLREALFATSQESEYMYQSGLRDIFVCVIPAQSRGMPAKHDLPTKLRGISKKLHLETSLIWIWHEIFFLEAVTFFDTLHCGLFFVCF